MLADGMSCKVQLDDLADVKALHLAELLCLQRTAHVNPKHRRLVIPVALGLLLLIVVIASVV